MSWLTFWTCSIGIRLFTIYIKEWKTFGLCCIPIVTCLTAMTITLVEPRLTINLRVINYTCIIKGVIDLIVSTTNRVCKNIFIFTLSTCTTFILHTISNRNTDTRAWRIILPKRTTLFSVWAKVVANIVSDVWIPKVFEINVWVCPCTCEQLGVMRIGYQINTAFLYCTIFNIIKTFGAISAIILGTILIRIFSTS